MKKFIKIFIGIIISIFLLIIYMVNNNSKYLDKIYEGIINNTEIKDITYYNKYDKYYIVCNNDYVYVLNSDFKENFKIDINKIYDNKKKYDIIYRNEILMYFNEYYKDNILYYEYYDILTYELVEKIQVGDNNE